MQNKAKRQYPDTALAVYMDLGDMRSIKTALEEGRKRFGQIDILVNNAGHGYRATVEESEECGIDEVFRSNFFAPARLIQMVLPDMRKRKEGLIVNVTSIGAVRGALGNGYYSAAKGALELLTESLAKEVQNLGIQTMIVEPGAFQTGFYGDHLLESSVKIADYDPIAKSYRKEYVDPATKKNGNPLKGGQVIVDVILNGELPDRLLLGSDAVSAAQSTYQSKLDELNRWKAYSVLSDD